MTREEIKRWLPEMIAFSEGKELLLLDNDEWLPIRYPQFSIDGVYVINDKHVESRKAFALGKPILVTSAKKHNWVSEPNPTWEDNHFYKPETPTVPISPYALQGMLTAYNSKWVANWSDGGQYRYFIYIDDDDMYSQGCEYTEQTIGTIYMSKEAAQWICGKLNSEKLN